MTRLSRSAFILALLAAISFLASGSAWAQCPMCRMALETQGPNAASTINIAIMVLLFPAVALFSGVYYVAYHTAKSVDSGVEQHLEVQ